MTLKAIALNCTLKPSPEVSNTEALLNKVLGIMQPLGVDCELLRVSDFNIPFGVSSDQGGDDQWPEIYAKIRAAQILIIGTPIWMGARSSVTQMVIERLDGSYSDADSKTGQFPLYNKAAGVVITGNEDGAHAAAETTLFNLTHLGCTVPPNADCYWVGDAGPGPSYLDEGGGKRHLYTNKTARYMAHNLVHIATLIQERPFPTNLAALNEDAQQESD